MEPTNNNNKLPWPNQENNVSQNDNTQPLPGMIFVLPPVAIPVPHLQSEKLSERLKNKVKKLKSAISKKKQNNSGYVNNNNNNENVTVVKLDFLTGDALKEHVNSGRAYMGLEKFSLRKKEKSTNPFLNDYIKNLQEDSAETEEDGIEEVPGQPKSDPKGDDAGYESDY